MEVEIAANQKLYDESFFDHVRETALKSAKPVIERLKENLKIESVLDVGCGQGAWLNVWKSTGTKDIVGIDGDYVKKETLLISPTHFISHDLRKEFNLNRSFDFVQSLEVAEHIESASADLFIKTLCKHGKVVMFSAATPGQGGTDHINEQSFEYWRKKFEAQGYEAYDYVRPAIQANMAVEFWYRYNIILYIHKSLNDSLSPEITKTKVAATELIPIRSPLSYQLRCKLLSYLSPKALSNIAYYKMRVVSYFN